MSEEYLIYKHTSPSNKVYIGITSQTPEKRWHGGANYSGQPYFYNAIRKYGWDNFKHDIIRSGLTEEEAKIAERKLIKRYDSRNREFGYNAGYYPNMRHDAVKDKFRRYLDENVYDKASAILDSFPGDVGFNPGSQIIQIAGISLLDDLDHYVKERLRVKYYVRYMDDILIIGESKEELLKIKEVIRKELFKIGFELHEEKSKVISLLKEVLFLGFKYRITETGRVLMIVDPARVRAERKKLFRLVGLAKQGKISKEKVDQCYQSWRSHALKGNSWKLIQRMDDGNVLRKASSCS